jgi:hypothetical protein
VFLCAERQACASGILQIMLKFKVLQFLLLFSIIGLTDDLFCQDTVKSKLTFGVRFNSGYDFQVKHDNNLNIIRLAPIFSVNLRNHNFYLGPQYSYIFQPTPVSDEIYDNNSFGLSFGYRYYSGYFVDNLRMFGQLNYSLFWVKYSQYQHGLPYWKSITQFYIKNDVSIGFDYRVVKKLHLALGFGIGSYHAFFLVLDNFTFTSYIGIEYVF